MADLFNHDFQDFIECLNKAEVEYILVVGYAVILHGYIRSTADMDVWVNRSGGNYYKLQEAFVQFGAPIFSMEEFSGIQYDVWGIGIEPNKIEVSSKIQGVSFSDAFPHCKIFTQNNVNVRYIHLKHLLLAKEASGRFKDKADIEELIKKKK